MEDDNIKKLFADFAPSLSSDSLFMAQLERRMQAVEMVKRHTAARHRASRIAVVVAAVAGFAMGALLSLFLPLLADRVSDISISVPDFGGVNIPLSWQIAGWVIMAALSSFTAINAYTLTMARLRAKL